MARSDARIDPIALIALACAGVAGLAAAAAAGGAAAHAESALVLACCALGLAAAAGERRRAARALGALALVWGLADLLARVLGLPPNPLADWLLADGGGMAPHGALAAALFGTGLWMAGPGRNRRLRWVGAGVLGGSVTVLGLAGLGGHGLGLQQSYAWSPLTTQAPAAAAGLVACGAGLVALVWRANAADRQRYGIGISLSIAGGLAASLLLGAAMLDQEGRSRRELARSELERLAHALAVVTEVHSVELERMADRWGRDGSASAARWRADARSHLGRASAYTALGWIGADGRARWETGRGPGPPIAGERLAALRAGLEPGGGARLRDAFPEPGGVAAAAAAGDGTALVGLIDVAALVELAWGDAAGEQRVSLEGAGGSLHASGRAPGAATPAERTRPPLRGLDWQLIVAPAGSDAVGAAPALAFIAGTGLTLMVSFAMALRRTALERAEALEGVSRELEASAAQLLSTNAELLRSNEELGRFATLASHDLQEPLRQIISFSERLEEKHADALDEHGRTYLGFVTEAASRARVLIEDLLRYARVDGQALHRETVDCDAALREAIDSLRSRIEVSGAEIQADSLPAVRGNAVLLTQLFQNLLANALKYSGGRTPRIRVGVRDAGAMWEFSVRDRGIGIHPDYHRKVFEIFERLPQDEEGEVEGTGVGLALCKKVVERHGGEIRVESAPGAGSDFRFSIPKLEEAGPGTGPDPAR